MNGKKMQIRKGLTVLEMVIAVSIMAVLFAAILPQFRTMYLGWDSRTRHAEIVQNARILSEQLKRTLSSAGRITAVSQPGDYQGYIEFEKTDNLLYRLELSLDGQIRYGQIGNLYELAGPATQLQFVCYSLENLTTSTTEVDDIRFVNITVTIANSQDSRTQTYSQKVFIQTNVQESPLIAWYKFDELNGLVAEDSTFYNRDGRLMNMSGTEWTEGYVGGGLKFDGVDDYVTFDLEWNSTSATIMAWAKLDSLTSWGAELININDVLGLRLDQAGIGCNGFYYVAENVWEIVSDNYYAVGTGWHHYVYVFDSDARRQELYIDGELVHSRAAQNAINFQTLPTTCSNIGQHANVSKHDLYFNGIIDDVRIYNIALSEEDVQQTSPPAIHHWTLNETDKTMIDSIGNMDGTCKGDVTVGEPSLKEDFGTCVYLDGQNDLIELLPNSPLNALDDFSVSAWIKPSQTKWPVWFFGRDTTESGWSFGMSKNFLELSVWDRKSYKANYSLPMEEWSHVAACFESSPSGAKLLDFYVNGEFVDQQSVTSAPNNGDLADGWVIGSCDGSDHFKGNIDEVKIFEFRLTAEQVRTEAGLPAITDPYLNTDIRP